jgi:hypothetical protein
MAEGLERAICQRSWQLRVEWHMSCSLEQWSTVKPGILRTAVPILTISGILLWSLGPSADSGITADRFELALARFNTTAPPAYRAFRRLEAGTVDSGKHAWLEAWTEHRPGNGLNYTVIRESGSEYVRHEILRKLLNEEQKLVAAGKPLRAPIVPRNYDLADGGVTTAGLRCLLLHPTRKSDGLVRGAAFIEPDGGNVVRIEGRLTKSPSFWVRDVDVTWKFAPFGDAMLPIELSSSARVLFHGRQPFRMTYDYEQVGGRAVTAPLRAAMPDNPHE